MATWPASVVEIAVASDPLDTSPSWTDVTDDVVGVSLREGAEHELSEIDASVCEIRLKNRTGTYTRQNPASPHYPDLTIGKRVRWRATKDTVTYDLFDGWIESFDPRWDPGNPNEEIMVLTCVGAHQQVSLAAVPVSDDHAQVVEETFDPLWAYWTLGDRPGTKVLPGGKTKVPKGAPRNAKPVAVRAPRRVKTISGLAGPEGIVVGNPTFLVEGGDGSIVVGELAYGIQFARASSQHVKFPVNDSDELPAGGNNLAVAATFRMTSLSLVQNLIVGGPLTVANAIPWKIDVENVGGELHIVWRLEFSDGSSTSLTSAAFLTAGIDNTDSFYSVVGTWNGDTDEAQLFLDDVLMASSNNPGKTLRRGNAPGFVYVGGHPEYTAASGTNVYANAVIAQVIVSERAFPNDVGGQGVELTPWASSRGNAGMGSPAQIPKSGARIDNILAYVDSAFWSGAMLDTDTGAVDVTPQRWDGSTALDLIREVEETEDGLFWFAGDGKATFRDAAWRAGDGYEIQARFTDRPVGLYGIAVGGAFEFMSTTDITAAMADLKALGVRTIRADCKWSQVEASQGVYVWEAGGGAAKYDTLMEQALAQGLDVILTCTYSPTWVTGAGADDKVAPSTTGERDAFAAFVKAVVERYGPDARWNVTGGGLKAVEIWNEPNLGNTFYKPAADPAGYTDLLQRSWDAVLAVDPNVVHPSRRPLVLAGTLAASSHYTTGEYVKSGGNLYTANSDYVTTTPPTGWTQKTPWYGTWATSPTNYVTGGFVEYNGIIYTLIANDNSPRSGGATPDVTPAKYTAVWGAQNWSADYAKGREPGKFLEQMYTAGAVGHFDHLSAHPYVFGGPPPDLDFVFEGWKYPHATGSFLGDTNSLRSIMVANGDEHKQIWITETSYDSVTDANRAAYAGDILARLSSYGYVGPICWYTYYVASDARSIVGAPSSFTHDVEWDALETYLDDADPLELPYRSLVPADDLDFLFNTVTVTRQDGVAQTVSDTASIDQYGTRRLPEITTLHTTDAQALTHAETLLARYKDPLPRVKSIALDGAMDDLLWPKILGLRLFDRVIVRRLTPGGVHLTYDCRVRGRTLDVAGMRWSCTLQLAPEPF